MAKKRRGINIMKHAKPGSAVPGTRALLASAVLMASSGLLAAEKVDLHQQRGQLLAVQTLSAQAQTADALVALAADESLQLLRENADHRGHRFQRLQQQYRGLPVWGEQIIVERDQQQRAVNLYGSKINGIAADIHSIKPKLDGS